MSAEHSDVKQEADIILVQRLEQYWVCLSCVYSLISGPVDTNYGRKSIMPCRLILNIYSLLANSVPGHNGTDIYLVLCMVFERLFIQNNCARMVRSIARAADYLSTPIATFPEQRRCCTEYHDAEWAILLVHRWQFGRGTEYMENKSVDRISVCSLWSNHCPFHYGRCPLQSTCWQGCWLVTLKNSAMSGLQCWSPQLAWWVFNGLCS